MVFPALVSLALAFVLAASLAARRSRRARSEVVGVRFRDRTIAEISIANLGRRDLRVVSVALSATWSDDEADLALADVHPADVRLIGGGTATVGAPLRRRLPPPSCNARVHTTVVLSDGSRVQDARTHQF